MKLFVLLALCGMVHSLTTEEMLTATPISYMEQYPHDEIDALVKYAQEESASKIGVIQQAHIPKLFEHKGMFGSVIKTMTYLI